jgi:hypothetical protein
MYNISTELAQVDMNMWIGIIELYVNMSCNGFLPVQLSSRFFFFYLDYETIGTAATPGLLCQPWVIMKMIVESMMECRLAGETEVLGENLPQHQFCPSQNPTCPPGFEPGPPRWEAGD